MKQRIILEISEPHVRLHVNFQVVVMDILIRMCEMNSVIIDQILIVKMQMLHVELIVHFKDVEMEWEMIWVENFVMTEIRMIQMDVQTSVVRTVRKMMTVKV